MSETLTFRPLSRGRYRCKQTGALVTKAGLDPYCRSHGGNRRGRTAEFKTIKLNVTMTYRERRFTCLNCHTKHHYLGGSMETACSCGAQIVIRRLSPWGT